MRTFTRSVLALALVPMLGACAPMGATFNDEVQKKSENPGDEIPEKPLSCLDDQPDYVLDTRIGYFQLDTGVGVKVGVSALGSFLGAIGLGVDYASGELGTMMRLSNPLNRRVPISDRTGASRYDKVKVDFNFGIQIVTVGLSYFSQTPLGKLTEGALRNNLEGVTADIKDTWSTHISRTHENGDLQIPVGSKAGVKIGDEFSIYEVSWEFTGGSPCKGDLQYPRKLGAKPIATAVVAQNPFAAYTILTITKIAEGKKISQYDLVETSKLVVGPPTCEEDWLGNVTCKDAPARALNRSVKLTSITGNPILFDKTGNGNFQPIDITPVAFDQLKSIVNLTDGGYGFYRID